MAQVCFRCRRRVPLSAAGTRYTCLCGRTFPVPRLSPEFEEELAVYRDQCRRAAQRMGVGQPRRIW